MHEIEMRKMVKEIEREIEEQRMVWRVQLDLIERQRRMAVPAAERGLMARLWARVAGRPSAEETRPVQPEPPQVEPRRIEAEDLGGSNALLRFFQGGEGA